MACTLRPNTQPPSTEGASAIVFILDLIEKIDIRISWVLVEFEKQTDGTRRRTQRANPDVESKFSKNNYTLINIAHMTTNQRLPSCS
jgi:3-hydroxy-3-methylglutaryl CoA synthase